MQNFRLKLKLFNLLFLLHLGTFIFAQSASRDYLLKYNFDNTDIEKAKLYNKSYVISKFSNGSLQINHTEDGTSWYQYFWAYINWKENFSITTNFRYVEGDTDAGYGIMFGGKDFENCFVFDVSFTGYYRLCENVNGRYVELKAWTKSSNINSNENKVEVKKEKDNFDFYVNGKLTYSYKAEPFLGFYFGYHITNILTIKSDYFIAYQKAKPINLIENAMGFGNKVSLGKNVNSYAVEKSPKISLDEKTLYISRAEHAGNMGNTDNSDIWYSELNVKDSTWGLAKNIGKPLNNSGNNFIGAISSDNSTIFVGNKYTRTGEISGKGFSVSHKTQNGWSMPKDLEIKNFYNYHKYNEICLSPSGQVMLLALQREQTEGFKDIYVSFLQKDSSWSEPKNIGNVVNTFADETSPFIAADGITMYFSTAGHPGYGDNDIFMTKRLDDSWTKWSTPKNLGPKINTYDWEAYYTIPASGKNAYIVSAINGNEDIFKLKQPESAKPLPVELVKGIVLNSETKQPMEATVTYSELGSKKILGHAKSDPVTGKFVLSLPTGKKYCVVANKTNFISVHESSDILNLKKYSEHEIDLFLTPMKKGQSVVLNNLFFKANSAEIHSDSYPELDKLYEIMKLNPKIKITINGHTSKNYSNAEWNMNLSTNRALAVKNYLVEKGINEKRITHKGYGFSKPIFTQMDEAHLAKNRRVEFVITEN